MNKCIQQHLFKHSVNLLQTITKYRQMWAYNANKCGLKYDGFGLLLALRQH